MAFDTLDMPFIPHIHSVNISFIFLLQRVKSSRQWSKPNCSSNLPLDFTTNVNNGHVLAARCYAQAQPMPSCDVWCLSIHLSDMFVYSVKKSKHIFKILSLSGSHTIVRFPYKMLSDGDPLTGAKISMFDQYLALRSMAAQVLNAVNSFCGEVIYSTKR